MGQTFNPDTVLEQFEDAWQTGTVPRIEALLPPSSLPAMPADERRTLLAELIKIDLSYRWRGVAAEITAAGLAPVPGTGPTPLPACPKVEDYLGRYPELGPPAQASLDLIAAEYWVRCHHGDRPDHQEYFKRFSRHGPILRETLQRVDAELAAEFAHPKVLPAGQSEAMSQIPYGSEAVAPVVSLAAFVDALRRCPLLQPANLAEVEGELQNRFPEPRTLAKELLRRGWLTPYQANQVLLGKAGELLLGPYLVLERLGEGGAGRVLKARHQRMSRIVALKLIRRDLLADAEVVGRFYREIEIIGRLSHPHIVHAYDAGPLGGTHALVMEYVEGVDLGQLVKQSGPLSVSKACEYVRQAALGLEYAHQHRLVHRDVKPANLLLCKSEPHGSGTVKILDLGLARLRAPMKDPAGRSASGDLTSMLTPVGAVMMMGTPDYLAPEQALDFHGADIRADVYSLGCTLFFLLTGQPPFANCTVPQKLLKHQQMEPPVLDQFRSDVPSQVVGILRRMMAKRPDDRFATPGAVAAVLADLQNSRVLSTDSTLSLVGGGRGKFGAICQAVWSRPRLRNSLASAILLFGLGVGVWGLFWRGPSPSGPRPPGMVDALNPADVPAVERYAWQPKELVAVRGEHGWHVADDVRWVAVSADRKTIASAGVHVQLWDAQTGRQTAVLKGHGDFIESLAFSPDHRFVATGGRVKTVRLWDLSTGKDRIVLLKQAIGAITSLAFAPDGKVLACGTADGSVKLLDLATDAERTSLPVGGKEVTSLAFVRNGQVLAAASADGTAKLWEYPGLKEQATVRCGDNQRTAFFADGRALACGYNDKPINIWDVAPANLRNSWKVGDGSYRSLAVAPDGRTLATGFFNRNSWGPCALKLWDPATGQLRSTLAGHSGTINALAFFPDSRTLVSGGNDSTLRLWDVETGRERDISRSRWGRFYPQVACTPDGKIVAAARLDDTVKVWDLISGNELGSLVVPSRPPVQPGSGIDGQPIVWWLNSAKLHVWNVRTGKEQDLPYTIPATVWFNRLTLAPDGKTLALPGKDGVVSLWDFSSGQELATLRGADADLKDLQFTPDGKFLLALGGQGSCTLWNVATRVKQATYAIPLPGTTILSAAPAQDERRIALAVWTGASHEVVLWDTSTAKALQRWELPWATRPAFAPDGRHLILSNANGTAYVLRLK